MSAIGADKSITAAQSAAVLNKERYGEIMNRHTVFVAGKRFVLLSDDSNEYVADIAREVNEAVKRISEENPTMESRSCAVLCALDYADDKNKEIQRSKRLSEKAKTVMEQADRHAGEIKQLKEKLSKRESEIEKLKEEIRTLKAEKAPEKKAPEKKEKRHSHPHINPYKQQAQDRELLQNNSDNREEKPAENQSKGYKPVRQISLFENE